jgi:hypothetical protein
MSGALAASWTALRDATLAAGDAARDAANVTTLRVAVTGLSRAGKTVFLVSLISNLLALGRGVAGERFDGLPQLRKRLADGQGGMRLLNVSLEPSGAQAIPRFAYESHRDGMASGAGPAQGPGPVWPPFTDRPAFIALRLELAPEGFFGRARGLALGPRIIRLELLDYPGEWLVDLPLLEQGFAQWSAETMALLQTPPRQRLASEFLAFTATLAPGALADDNVAAHGFRLYQAALHRCREEAGLRWLQPGRALMPGPWGEVPLLQFFPWAAPPDPVRGTLAALLRDRFEAYKRAVREEFFRPYFSLFDRQVVLVDVLGALWAGKAAFDDTRHALQRIGASYARLLDGGLFGTGLFSGLVGGRIRRVAFAATKSDHVDDLQREHLRKTLEHMVAPDAPHGRRMTFHQICAVRCTTDADVTGKDGRMERVVMGVPLGGHQQRPFTPGPVPAGEVPDTYWQKNYFVLPEFRPPEFQAGDAHPIAHINLDRLLVALLEDVL